MAALASGGAITAGEVATATGLGRASVSTMLSQLVKIGELIKAPRGYQLAGVEPAQRFYFRIEDDATPRAVVANLPELEAAIVACDAGVLPHYCAEQNFSRWVAGVFHNEPLAADIAAAEAQLSADSPSRRSNTRARRSSQSSSLATPHIGSRRDPSVCDSPGGGDERGQRAEPVGCCSRMLGRRLWGNSVKADMVSARREASWRGARVVAGEVFRLGWFTRPPVSATPAHPR